MRSQWIFDYNKIIVNNLISVLQQHLLKSQLEHFIHVFETDTNQFSNPNEFNTEQLQQEIKKKYGIYSWIIIKKRSKMLHSKTMGK